MTRRSRHLATPARNSGEPDSTAVGRSPAADSPPQPELEIILDSMPALVWIKDRHNRVLRANRPAAAAIGKTPDEMAGVPTQELYPGEADSYYQDDLEVITTGKPSSASSRRCAPPPASCAGCAPTRSPIATTPARSPA